MVEHNSKNAFVSIVYAKVKSNGKTELVPLRLYVDGSPEQIRASFGLNSETAMPAKTTIADRYLIQKALGQGGFGRTYLAIDQHRFNEFCVLKEFLPNNTGDYEMQKSRDLFEREARMLHQIHHPQIPKFLACFEADERLFLVQEYVPGKTYSSLLWERQQKGQVFSESEVIQWLKDLLPVLDYIHDRKIIHRDISPDNIMQIPDKKLPVLIDFGVGKQTIETSSQTHYSRKNSVVGKIGYAPHEQISLGQCFPSSDLYSLAVTAVVLLTGKEPEFLMVQHTLEWRWQAYAQVSDRFAQVLNKMLSIKPSDRYPSAKAVLADLNTPATPKQTVLSQPPSPIETTPTPNYSVNSEFIHRCEQELMSLIGPIASFLVSETLSQSAGLPPNQFVQVLAQKIPNYQQAIAFQQRVLY